MMNDMQTITKNETTKHLKSSPTRRHVDKKPGHSSTIRYIQGSLLDYLETSVIDPQQHRGDHV